MAGTLHAITPKKNSDLLRDCLTHALQDASIARLLVENFGRVDFPSAVAEVYDALAGSLTERGGVDHVYIAEKVGWATLTDAAGRECSFASVDTYSVVGQLLRDRRKEEAVQAIRLEDYVKAADLLNRISVPQPGDAARYGRVTEATVADFLKTTEENADREYLGFRTGILPLDRLTLGLAPTSTWAVAAVTSGGKTAMACQIVDQVLLQGEGGVVLYVSLEMSSKWILARLIGANQGLNSRDIYMGQKTDSVRPVLGLYQQLPLYIRDDVHELADIVRAVREVKAREGRLDLVVVDFVQNVFVKSVNMQVERMAIASTRLQSLAGETGACMMVLSQLSNEAVRDKGKGALTFRYASELAHAADVAMELIPENDGTTTCLVRKNRAGGTGNIRMRWTGNYSRFEVAT